jgi:hypothetical protein
MNRINENKKETHPDTAVFFELLFNALKKNCKCRIICFLECYNTYMGENEHINGFQRHSTSIKNGGYDEN